MYIFAVVWILCGTFTIEKDGEKKEVTVCIQQGAVFPDPPKEI